MIGVPLDRVVVRLGHSRFPVSAGSGGQWGANSSTAGVYAACMALRQAFGQRSGFNAEDCVFEDGRIRAGNRSVGLAEAPGPMASRRKIRSNSATSQSAMPNPPSRAFPRGGRNADTGEVRVPRMLGAFAAGRILNPKAARSQVIGSMTMGVGAALMEAVVDKRFGYFVNHDLAEYHVPVHADIPNQEVIFVEELDDKSSPMKAKGVGELGLCGAGAAIANVVYNACGVRIRDYPLTLDKILERFGQR